MNQYETQAILESFERAGFTIVPFLESADVYFINTCSVTGQAESKSLQAIRSAARRNPNAKVIVTGCAAQMSLNQGRTIESAHLVVPNPEKLNSYSHFVNAFPAVVSELSPAPATQSPPFRGRSRATIKIQDGCSVLCSYCSIPYTRPVMSSRPWTDIVEEANRYAKLGHREIILAGVLIGSYGPKTGSGGPYFEELLSILNDQQSLQRIRISSIEVRQVSERLIDLMGISDTKIAPHLHIPLQSGSSEVLKTMNRPYSQRDYLDLCRTLYSRIPNLAISTDIMVGYPTESDEEFEETIKVCEAVKFAKGHIFRFSPRPGTPAHELGDPVTPQAKHARSSRLIQITNESREQFHKRFIGRTRSVVVEGRGKERDLLSGISDNYLEVLFPGSESLAGHLVDVQLREYLNGKLLGELSTAEMRSRNNPKLLRLVN